MTLEARIVALAAAIGADVKSLLSSVAGAVAGAASSTDNAFARFSGTGGKTLKNSTATLDNSGNAAFVGLSLTGSLKEAKAALDASAIDLATGNYFTKTISTTTTFTVSNVPASGTVGAFVLELTNGGAATVNWFSGVKWAGGTAPTLTAAGVDILGFYTHDAGTTWRGLVLAKDSK